MSFGVSAGDILTAIELANRIRSRYVNALDQFKAISDEVRNLSDVLRDMDDIPLQRNSPDQQKTDFSEITQGCQDIVKELEETLDQYQELGPNTKGSAGRLKRAWKRLKWDQTNIDRLRNRITSNVLLFNTRLTCISNQTISATGKGVDELLNHQQNGHQRAILHWISPIDYDPQQQNIIERRQDGTGQWLLDSIAFQTWVGQKGGTLFCPGIPGAGKTMMSAIVVDHLIEYFEHQADTRVAYIYCSYQPQHEQKPGALLLAVMKHIIRLLPTVPAAVERLYEHHRQRGSRPSIEEIVTALRATVQLFSRVFIIVDALDEYYDWDNDGPKTLLSEIFKLQDEHRYPVNLFATSRHIAEITSQFDGCTSKEIRAQDDDVLEYINGEIPQLLRSKASICHEDEEAIRSNVMRAADGMFLLARLHMESLKGKLTLTAIKKAIIDLPQGMEGLDQTYSQAMRRIQGQGKEFRELAEQVLSWVLHARKALSIKEIQHALSIRKGMWELDKDSLLDVEIVGSVCAGLIEIDRNSDSIRLVHYTAKEYFERMGSFPNAETAITMACVRYLSFEAFAVGACRTDKEFETRLRQNPLYDYSARNWGHHANAASPEVGQMIFDFLTSDAKVSAASQAMLVCENLPDYSQQVVKGVRGVHLAAFFGLQNAMTLLLENGHDPGLNNDNGQTPLMLAAKNGHEALVELLLQRKVDFGVFDNSGRTALHYAADNGCIESLNLLLTSGADIEARDSQKRTALHNAADNGCIESLNLLLTSGADIEARDSQKRTALHYAADNGCIESLNLLLTSGADIEARDSQTQTPLLMAVARAQTRAVSLLVKAGADTKTLDAQKRGVLHLAIENPYSSLETLKLLILQSTPSDSIDVNNMTPLHYTIRHNRQDFAELLIESGVPIDIGVQRKIWNRSFEDGDDIYTLDNEHNVPEIQVIDNNGLTPLHYAAIVGSKRMTHFLLDHGANPNALSHQGETPLHLALCRQLQGPARNYIDGWTEECWRVEVLYEFIDYEESGSDERYNEVAETRTAVVDAILDNHATDATVRDSQGASLLHFIRYGQPYSARVVSKLLAKGVKVRVRNSKKQTALHLACLAGDSESVHVLLDGGADIAFPDHEGLNALHYAAMSGDTETISSILQALEPDGDNLIRSTDEKGRNALHHLTTRAVVEAAQIQLLLGHGISIRDTDDLGNPPLVLCLSGFCSDSKVKLCRFMLEEGAEAMFVNDKGQTLAHLSVHCSEADVEVLKVLMEFGVDMSATDLQGKTLLHHIALSGSLTDDTTLEFLLEKTTLRLNNVDIFGKTALDYAVESQGNFRKSTLFDFTRWARTRRIFEEHGAVTA